MRPALLLAAALLAYGPIAAAQDAATIYRCTAASGEVTIQNGTPCPAGAAITQHGTIGGFSIFDRSMR